MSYQDRENQVKTFIEIIISQEEDKKQEFINEYNNFCTDIKRKNINQTEFESTKQRLKSIQLENINTINKVLKLIKDNLDFLDLKMMKNHLKSLLTQFKETDKILNCTYKEACSKLNTLKIKARRKVAIVIPVGIILAGVYLNAALNQKDDANVNEDKVIAASTDQEYNLETDNQDLNNVIIDDETIDNITEQDLEKLLNIVAKNKGRVALSFYDTNSYKVLCQKMAKINFADEAILDHFSVWSTGNVPASFISMLKDIPTKKLSLSLYENYLQDEIDLNENTRSVNISATISNPFVIKATQPISCSLNTDKNSNIANYTFDLPKDSSFNLYSDCKLLTKETIDNLATYNTIFNFQSINAVKDEQTVLAELNSFSNYVNFSITDGLINISLNIDDNLINNQNSTELKKVNEALHLAHSMENEKVGCNLVINAYNSLDFVSKPLDSNLTDLSLLPLDIGSYYNYKNVNVNMYTTNTSILNSISHCFFDNLSLNNFADANIGDNETMNYILSHAINDGGNVVLNNVNNSNFDIDYISPVPVGYDGENVIPAVYTLKVNNNQYKITSDCHTLIANEEMTTTYDHNYMLKR